MFRPVIKALLIGLVSLQVVAGAPEDNSFFAARRKALMEKLEGSVAVLQGAPETRAYIPFRQDNNFYYLTGVEAPDALLLIDGTQHRSILFLPPRNEELERWEGARLYPGPEARKQTGIEEVLQLSQFGEELEKRRSTLRDLYTPLTPSETAAVSRDRVFKYEEARKSNPWDGRISREEAFSKSLQSKSGSANVRDLSPILDEMRRVKDSLEIERLRVAGSIGAAGLKAAIQSAAPGMYEYQVASVAEFVFLMNGALGYSFFPIVGSGPNSCIVHYSGNQRKMESGDIVVMDFGADYQYYASDITRTFPASGKFTEEQKNIYQVVLESQKAALGRIRPGATFRELGDVVREVLDRYAYARFLTHSVSHYIGMATHDVGKSKPFEPGVVITIEPGVYMPEKKLGIRIEDTVLVTKDGCEVLTKDVPKEIAQIEKLMAEPGVAPKIGN